MATSDVIDKICDHVTCSLCLEKYKEPKSLPCQHTFCCQCITTYIEKQGNDYSSTSINWFKCPVCRAETTIPKSGISAFPTNFILQNIAQDIEQSEIKEASPRANDESSGKHGIGGKSNGTAKWTCEKHEGCDVMRFCMNCRLPLCATCLVDIIGEGTNPHLNHTINDLEKAKQAVHQETEKKSQKVEEYRTKLIDQSKFVSDMQANLNDDHEKAIREIKDVRRKVTEWAESMTVKVNDFKTEHEEKLRKTRDDIEAGIAILQTGQQEIQSFKQKERNVLLNSDNVNGRLQNILDNVDIDMASLQIPTRMSISIKWSNDGLISNIATSDITCNAEYTTVNSKPGDSHSMPLNRRCSASEPFLNALAVTSFAPNSSSHTHIVINSLHTLKPVTDLEGMCFTQHNTFFAVNNETQSVHHFRVSNNYDFCQEDIFGNNCLKQPWDVDQLPDGRIVVCDGAEGHSVKVFSKLWNGWKRTGFIAHSMLHDACSIAVSPEGDVIVCDSGSDTGTPAIYSIRLLGGDRYDVKTTVQKYAGGKCQFKDPWHVTCSASGYIAVSDQATIKCFDKFGRYLWKYGKTSHGADQLNDPRGVCFDSQGRLFVCDSGLERIHVVSSQGKLIGHIPYSWLYMAPHVVCFTPKGDIVLGQSDGLIRIFELKFD